jgi:tRNA 2-selenouridine synthase
LKYLSAQEFIGSMQAGTLIDVRTPAEWEKGHIPSAKNLPLFTNEERVIVGTIYKLQGRQPAILKGLELVGPRMKEIVDEAISLSTSNKIFVYCWRGGMRSASIAWLLDMYGFDVLVLKRGYKAFRNFALNSFNVPKNLLVLGGKTGSGKTMILHEMAILGEPFIDLEGLAHHKGSAFGTIGESDNCSQEHFENKLAMTWIQADPIKKIWIEDESRSIGKKILPEKVWNLLRNSRVINLDIPIENRIDFLVKVYGQCSKEELLDSTIKIKNRLGGLAYKLVTDSITNNELATAAGILLGYYDKAYQYGLEKRDPETISNFKTNEKDFTKIAKALLEFARKMGTKQI